MTNRLVRLHNIATKLGNSGFPLGAALVDQAFVRVAQVYDPNFDDNISEEQLYQAAKFMYPDESVKYGIDNVVKYMATLQKLHLPRGNATDDLMRDKFPLDSDTGSDNFPETNLDTDKETAQWKGEDDFEYGNEFNDDPRYSSRFKTNVKIAQPVVNPEKDARIYQNWGNNNIDEYGTKTLGYDKPKDPKIEDDEFEDVNPLIDRNRYHYLDSDSDSMLPDPEFYENRRNEDYEADLQDFRDESKGMKHWNYKNRDLRDQKDMMLDGKNTAKEIAYKRLQDQMAELERSPNSPENQEKYRRILKKFYGNELPEEFISQEADYLDPYAINAPDEDADDPVYQPTRKWSSNKNNTRFASKKCSYCSCDATAELDGKPVCSCHKKDKNAPCPSKKTAQSRFNKLASENEDQVDRTNYYNGLSRLDPTRVLRDFPIEFTEELLGAYGKAAGSWPHDKINRYYQNWKENTGYDDPDIMDMMDENPDMRGDFDEETPYQQNIFASILPELNTIIADLEKSGMIKDAGIVHSIFMKIAEKEDKPIHYDDPRKEYQKSNKKYEDPAAQLKYPVDTAAHCRAAWSYINQAKNQKGYSY